MSLAIPANNSRRGLRTRLFVVVNVSEKNGRVIGFFFCSGTWIATKLISWLYKQLQTSRPAACAVCSAAGSVTRSASNKANFRSRFNPELQGITIVRAIDEAMILRPGGPTFVGRKGLCSRA